MTRDCSWCGRELDPADSWLLADLAEDRGAAFCRLEHVIPWAIRGARWSPGAPPLPDPPDAPLALVRQRAGQVGVEGFGSLDDVVTWAKAGGPWAA